MVEAGARDSHSRRRAQTRARAGHCKNASEIPRRPKHLARQRRQSRTRWHRPAAAQRGPPLRAHRSNGRRVRSARFGAGRGAALGPSCSRGCSAPSTSPRRRRRRTAAAHAGAFFRCARGLAQSLAARRVGARSPRAAARMRGWRARSFSASSSAATPTPAAASAERAFGDRRRRRAASPRSRRRSSHSTLPRRVRLLARLPEFDGTRIARAIYEQTGRRAAGVRIGVPAGLAPAQRLREHCAPHIHAGVGRLLARSHRHARHPRRRQRPPSPRRTTGTARRRADLKYVAASRRPSGRRSARPVSPSRAILRIERRRSSPSCRVPSRADPRADGRRPPRPGRRRRRAVSGARCRVGGGRRAGARLAAARACRRPCRSSLPRGAGDCGQAQRRRAVFSVVNRERRWRAAGGRGGRAGVTFDLDLEREAANARSGIEEAPSGRVDPRRRSRRRARHRVRAGEWQRGEIAAAAPTARRRRRWASGCRRRSRRCASVAEVLASTPAPPCAQAARRPAARARRSAATSTRCASAPPPPRAPPSTAPTAPTPRGGAAAALPGRSDRARRVAASGGATPTCPRCR